MNLCDLSEAVETVSIGYAAKFGLDRDASWFMFKLQEEVGELVQAFVNLKGMSRDRGLSPEAKRQAFADECADVLAHILLLARHEGVDLDEAVREKWLRWA